MVFEIRGSSLLLGHVFAPNLCITPGYCIIVGSVILPNIKIVFYSHGNKTHSHMDVFTHCLVLKARIFATWK